MLVSVGCATATIGEDPGVADPDDVGSGGSTSVGGSTDAGGTPSTGGMLASGAVGGAGRSAGAAAGNTARAGRGAVGAQGGRNASAAGTTGTVGRSGAGGRVTVGGGGRVVTGGGGRVVTGSGGLGTAGGTSASCPAPRDPTQPGATQGNSGSFATADAVCYFVTGTFNAWNCSNLGGRTITVNGTRVGACGAALPMPVDGGYYFDFSASTDGTTYTSFYWYTS